MASRDKMRLWENMYPQLTTSSGATQLTFEHLNKKLTHMT